MSETTITQLPDPSGFSSDRGAYSRFARSILDAERTRFFKADFEAVRFTWTAGAIWDEKRLSNGRIQAIFTSDGTPLGECR